MIDFHRKILADTVRNDAFKQALQRVIVPGRTIVADLGAGTGYLSFLAGKLGAKECHCYEAGDVWAVGKKIAEQNGFKKCRFVHRHSLAVKRPVQADVAVSETLGNYALEEHLLETMNDARERFLKPGGTLIPGRLLQCACPLTSDRLIREIDVWGGIDAGMDFSPARAVSFHNAYVRAVTPADLLQGEGAAQVIDTVDFTRPNESRRELSAQWKLPADVTVHGIALWWEAELVPGVTLSTSPHNPPTHWEQIMLPLLDPMDVKAGDALLLSLTSDTSMNVGMNLTWQLSLFREGRKAAESVLYDMRKGHLD